MGPRESDLPAQIERFLSELGFSNEDIQIGKSKVRVNSCVLNPYL